MGGRGWRERERNLLVGWAKTATLQLWITATPTGGSKKAALREREEGSRCAEGRRGRDRGGSLSEFPASLQSLVPCPPILGDTTGSLKQIPFLLTRATVVSLV